MLKVKIWIARVKIWSKVIGLFLLGAVAGIAYYHAYLTYQGVTRYSVVREAEATESYEDSNVATTAKTARVYSVSEGDIQDLGESPDPCTLKDVVCDGEIEEIVAKVYRLESSGGKNDACLAEGKYNGYGYAQSKFSWNCYDTKEEVKELVKSWFYKHLKDKTLAEATCYYNTGIVQSECKYYQNYLSL